MKVVIFQAGLGNQIFEYTFMQYVREHIDSDVRYVVRDDGNSHNGFEFNKWFESDMKLAPWYYRLYIRIADLFMYNLHLKNPYCNQFIFPNSKSNIYDGFWVRKQFYKPGYIKFKSLPLNECNAKVLKMMSDTNSVSIHVRRGDYLSPRFAKHFGNICTLEYYAKAIEIIRQAVDNPHFFVFSDDIAWVKENIKLGNATYIDWNTADDSIYDMYLMSHCKHNIIANSTFSFWGARLNMNDNIVVYPKKWYNEPWTAPNIFPEDWRGI